MNDALNTKDNKIKRGVIFTIIRTIMEIICGVTFLLPFPLYINDNYILVFWIVGVILSIVLSPVPHFFVKKTSFGLATICNTISQIFIGIIGVALITIILIIGNTSGSVGGWVVTIGMAILFTLVAGFFCVNMIIDAIVHFIVKRKNNINNTMA